MGAMDRRKTKQREIILNAVQSRCDHPTAEQIYEQVHQTDPKISMGTVYRNLSVLAEDEKIAAIKLPDADRFDLKTEPHNHFACEKCGRLFDIDVSYDFSLDNKSICGGFLIRSHQTVFKGICPECQKDFNK